MKIYTKTGDAGETGLFGGPRVRKDDVRIEAYGTVDELNAVIGQARTLAVDSGIDSALEQIQHDLFAIGAVLATPADKADRTRDLSDDARVEALERLIDQLDAELPPLREFVLPAGCPLAAALHVARGVARRAERRVVTLDRQPDSRIDPVLIRYLNRLSDLLFVMARAANHRGGEGDVAWRKSHSAG